MDSMPPEAVAPCVVTRRPSSGGTGRFFLLIFGLALLVRVAGLDVFPPGLWMDEGLKGMDAWRTWHATRYGPATGPLWIYPDIFPREPLFVWIQSVAVTLGGPRVIVLRLTSVLIGCLACLAFFGLVRSLERERGARFALVAAFVLCTLHWHAHFSRLIFRTNLVPLVACLLVWALSAARHRANADRTGVLPWIAAGLFLGLGFYTYLSWYFFLPVAAVWFWALAGGGSQAQEGDMGVPRGGTGVPPMNAVENHSQSQEEPLTGETPVPPQTVPPLVVQPPFVPPRKRTTFWTALAGVLIGAVLIVSPLVAHYLSSPGDLVGRPQAVSPLQKGWKAGLQLMGRNALDVALMFSFRGDHVGKHNIPVETAEGERPYGKPVFDLVWSLFFYAGLLRAGWEVVRRGKQCRQSLAWFAWLGCMSLPSVVTQTDSVNMLRNLGVTPAVAYFVALGWWWGYESVQRLGAAVSSEALARRKRLLGALLIGLLVYGAGYQVYKLWYLHPQAPGMQDQFNFYHVALAEMCEIPQDAPQTPSVTFVPTDYYEHRTFGFLTIERGDILPLDPVALLSRPLAGKARVDHRVICTDYNPRNLKSLRTLFPDAWVESNTILVQPPGGGPEQPVALMLHIPADSLLPRAEAKRQAARLQLNTRY